VLKTLFEEKLRAAAKRFGLANIACSQKRYHYKMPSVLLSNRPTLVNAFNHDGPATSLTLVLAILITRRVGEGEGGGSKLKLSLFHREP